MAKERGLVQVYTGKGKGKTTAALGLAVRALGWGKRVYVCQFLKPADQKSGEMCLIERFPQQLCWERIENGWPLTKGGPGKEVREKMRAAIAEIWPRIVKAVSEREYDLVILDEINYCLSEELIEFSVLEELLACRHPQVELVLTGRGASGELIKAADLVSEVLDIKHPYRTGTTARKGIEY